MNCSDVCLTQSKRKFDQKKRKIGIKFFHLSACNHPIKRLQTDSMIFQYSLCMNFIIIIILSSFSRVISN